MGYTSGHPVRPQTTMLQLPLMLNTPSYELGYKKHQHYVMHIIPYLSHHSVKEHCNSYHTMSELQVWQAIQVWQDKPVVEQVTVWQWRQHRNTITSAAAADDKLPGIWLQADNHRHYTNELALLWMEALPLTNVYAHISHFLHLWSWSKLDDLDI